MFFCRVACQRFRLNVFRLQVVAQALFRRIREYASLRERQADSNS